MTNANDLFNILFDRNLREVTAHFLQGVKLDFSWGVRVTVAEQVGARMPNPLDFKASI
jgi:hypothetical protein